MYFRTVLLSAGKTATGIEVPETVVTGLGSGKRPAVRVTINGHIYRSSIATMDSKFMVGVSAENREKAGIKAGDSLEVTIELDNVPREVAVPPDFRKALGNNAAAKKVFEKLSYSHQRRHVLAIEAAKTPETRQRRIDGAIAILLK